MRGLTAAAAAALMATACSEEAPQQNQQAAAPATPEAGMYQASFTVTELRTTDRSDSPATQYKQGGTATASGCVAADGTMDPALFAEGDDECKATSSYVRSGRISLQLECRRDGGQVMQSVNGTYSADGIKGEVSTTAYLAQPGDYAMTRTFTARRTGECTAAAGGGDGNATANAGS